MTISIQKKNFKLGDIIRGADLNLPHFIATFTNLGLIMKIVNLGKNIMYVKVFWFFNKSVETYRVRKIWKIKY